MTRSLLRCLGAGLLAGIAVVVPTQALAASPPPLPPTGTPTPASQCSSRQSCTALLLARINQHRERHHLTPLQLAPAQSHGAANCPGSYGHSVAMAATGGIWHTNGHYPHQSFPHNICVRYVYTGENVGEAFSGNEAKDIVVLDRMMMQEPHSATVCASTVNHACNILDKDFHSIGIGLYEQNGATWLTEDFIG